MKPRVFSASDELLLNRLGLFRAETDTYYTHLVFLLKDEFALKLRKKVGYKGSLETSSVCCLLSYFIPI